MEVKLNEVEVTKLNLQPGEILMVTLKNDDVDAESMNALAEGLRKFFPANKVAVMNVGKDGDLRFQTLAAAMAPDLSCSASTVGYCGDCNCGKREQIEGAK